MLCRYIKGACFHPKEQIEQMAFALFTVPMLHCCREESVLMGAEGATADKKLI